MMSSPTLIYVYDPLCGWCYGFHPVMEKIQQRFSGSLNIEVKPGGLATGDRAEPIGQGYSYISEASKQVEKATGIQFGENFKLLAEEGSYLYDSVPPCRAQMVINQLTPEHALSFAGVLHKALFLRGMNLNEAATYLTLIEEFDIDPDTFMNLFHSEKIAERLWEEFKWCENAGVTGFPALLIRIGEEVSLMTRGYRPYDTIESHIHHLILNLERMSKM